MSDRIYTNEELHGPGVLIGHEGKIVIALRREYATLREALRRYVEHMRPYMIDKDCLQCKEAEAAIAGNPRASEHVAWLRYNDHNGARPTTIHLCDSDAPGAFKVYRQPCNGGGHADG